MTSLLSEVFELLVTVRLGRFMDSGVLPTTQLAYRKGLGTCDALLCVSYPLQSALESVQEARIRQIDCPTTTWRVSKAGPILFLLAEAALSLLLSSVIFSILFFLSIGWYCGAGVFFLKGCISLSLNQALPTSFNNNNNNNRYTNRDPPVGHLQRTCFRSMDITICTK